MEYNGADFMEYPKQEPVYSKMRLVDADKVLKDITKAEAAGADRIFIDRLKDYFSCDVGLVEAIPLTDLFKAIHTIQLDGDDMSEFSAEYRDGYGDGTRNAIVEMVMSLYDNEGEFWEKYSDWEKEKWR